MKTAKLGAIFVIAVMALTALGAAYAHWEETLTIDGIMTTDDIDVAFYCEDSNDWEDDYTMDPTDCGEWINRQWEGQRREKNVGYMNVDIPADNNQILNIDVGDAYPCYYAHAFWCVINYGSVPVLIHSIKLTELSFDWTDEDGTVIGVVWDVDIDLTADTKYYVDVYFDGDSWEVIVSVGPVADPDLYDFFLMPTGEFSIDTQLDPDAWSSSPSQHMTGEYTGELEQDLCIHFENGCRQEADYDFTIEIVYYNWPEFVNP